MNKLIIISLLLLFNSCRSHKKVVTQTTTSDIVLDSVVYIDRVKIDTIKIPSEVLKVSVPLEVLRVDTVKTYQKGRITTKVVYRDGILNVDTRCDSLEKLVISTEKTLLKLKHRQEQLVHQSDSKEVIIKEVKWYYKGSLWIVIIFICFYVGKTIIKKGLMPF